MSIGLEFVKSVDLDWRKRLKYEDGSPYITAHCPVMNRKCVEEDCVFWKSNPGGCSYIEKKK